MIIGKIKEHIAKTENFKVQTKEELEQLRIQYLGKKGALNEFFAAFKEVPAAEKKSFGQVFSELEQKTETKIQETRGLLKQREGRKGMYADLTHSTYPTPLGAHHPVSLVKNEILTIFANIGFDVSDGPEIEDDRHDFIALNLPECHPVEDMQDTFFIQTNPGILLRTYTSSVQIRYMRGHQPSIRTIPPGRVFYSETVSARSHCLFHRVEGLYIDKDISFADLKQTLLYFTKEMFGKSHIRLRPSYFPFTEPSAKADIYWGLNNEVGYRIAKGTGWLEIMGCGMTDSNVLKNCGIDSDTYNGFTFGMGIEHIAILLYQVGDIRMFYENDSRFLKQFKSAY